MGVSCDRLRLGSSAALNYQTVQNNGRYCEKELSFQLVSSLCTMDSDVQNYFLCPPCPSQILSLGISWMAL